MARTDRSNGTPSASPSWISRRLDPDQRFGLRLSLIAIAVLLLAIPFSLLLLEVTRDGPLTEVDRAVADAIHEEVVGEEEEIFLLRVITNLGDPITLWVLVVMASVVLWRRGNRRTAIYVAVTPLVGGLISMGVKAMVGRARPEPGQPIHEALGESFPSGHALNATVTYGVLLLAFMPMIPRRWRWIAIAAYAALIAAIGASRLGLVVHYVSDVLAGYVLGFAWLAVATATFSHWREERGRGSVEVMEGVSPEVEESGA